MRGTCLYALSIAGLLLSPTVTLAQNTTAPATTSTTGAAPADDPNEMICHKGEPIVGTRLPGPRICHTRKEWKDIQYQTEQNIQQMQQQSRAGNPPGG